MGSPQVQFLHKYGIESDGAGLIDVARAGGVIDGDREIFRGVQVVVKNTVAPICLMFLTMFSVNGLWNTYF